MAKKGDARRLIAADMAGALRIVAGIAWQEARKQSEPAAAMGWEMYARVTEENATYLERIFVGQSLGADDAAIVAAIEVAGPSIIVDDEEPTEPDAWVTGK